MPNLFARQTALTNVGGRIDYISNPDRQENLLAVFDGAADLAAGDYWPLLAKECKAASKHAAPGRKSVQGRELTIQLSNALLQRMPPEQIAEKLSRSFEEKYHRPCMVAIHFNKSKTNLHAHLIYAERELLKEPEEKIAPRALFFDEEGKRHYKKVEILDDAGELRPGCKIVKKGEVYERRCFSSVDQTFSHKGWLREAKKEWLLPLRNGELRGDVEITEYDKASGKLPQQHVGKTRNSDSTAVQDKITQIEQYNQNVRMYNRMVDAKLVPPSVAVDVQEKVGKAKEKNRILAALVDRLKEIHRKLQADQKRRQQEQAQKAHEEYQRIQSKGKSLDSMILGAGAKANRRLQKQLDQATKKKPRDPSAGGDVGGDR